MVITMKLGDLNVMPGLFKMYWIAIVEDATGSVLRRETYWKKEDRGVEGKGLPADRAGGGRVRGGTDHIAAIVG